MKDNQETYILSKGAITHKKKIVVTLWFLTASALTMTYQNCGQGFQSTNEEELQSVSGAFDSILFSSDWDNNNTENNNSTRDFDRENNKDISSPLNIKGFFAVDPHVYYTRDSRTFCSVANPGHYKRLSGIDLRREDIIFLKRIPTQLTNNGVCPGAPAPATETPANQGSSNTGSSQITAPPANTYFMVGANIYYTNGGAYCKIKDHADLRLRTGKSTSQSLSGHFAQLPSNQKNEGDCAPIQTPDSSGGSSSGGGATGVTKPPANPNKKDNTNSGSSSGGASSGVKSPPTNSKVKGYFMSGINIYFSNGTEYCKITSMEQYEQKSGTKSISGLKSYPQGAQLGIPFKGNCQ